MKNLIVIIFIIASYVFIGNIMEKQIIPDESIRLRILASSNSIEDQRIKMLVVKSVHEELYTTLKEATSVDDARVKIINAIPKLSVKIEQTLKDNKTNDNYYINFGKNYFPVKSYKGITYNAGNYESLLIKLNKGKGDNWWCILFPPLCLLEAEESTNVEYKLLIKEIIEKYS